MALKYAKPAPFSGDPEEKRTVREFVLALRHYFAFQAEAKDVTKPELTDGLKIRFVAGLLSGAALLWYDSEGSGFRAYAKFEEALLKRFQPFPEAYVARANLHALQFGKDVSSFAYAFRKLVADLPKMDIGDQIFLFVEKLPLPIRAEVEREVAKAQSLEDIIGHALRAERVFGWAFSSTTSKLNGALGEAKARGDSGEQFKPKTVRVCYHCGKPGHIKPYCPELKAQKSSK